MRGREERDVARDQEQEREEIGEGRLHDGAQTVSSEGTTGCLAVGVRRSQARSAELAALPGQVVGSRAALQHPAHILSIIPIPRSSQPRAITARVAAERWRRAVRVAGSSARRIGTSW